MAVASFYREGAGARQRNFHPPKQASVTHWYRAATAQIDEAPDWRTVDMGAAVVDANVIHWRGDDWDLLVARKRNLK